MDGRKYAGNKSARGADGDVGAGRDFCACGRGLFAGGADASDFDFEPSGGGLFDDLACGKAD